MSRVSLIGQKLVAYELSALDSVVSSLEGFRPDWMSPPGATIQSILRERGISKRQFCKNIELSTKELDHLLDGRVGITIRLARKLSEALGSSVEFWMSRDFQFQESLANLRKREEEWVKCMPVRDMVTFGWIEPGTQSSERLESCLKFFGVNSTAAWQQEYGKLQEQVAFRTSGSFESEKAAVAAWLRQGEIEAARVDCADWNPSLLEKNIGYIRSFTRIAKPRRFLPKLLACCASSGVAVAIVRTPTGCRASGAVRFLSPQKALIQLSFRYLADDHFWFTLFHEIGHLLLHKPKGIVLEHMNTPNTPEEDEANEFAANSLVPTEYKQELMQLKANPREVIRFAVRLGVSPGIIVGQLQHLGKLEFTQLNNLKRRYSWA